VVNRYAHLCQGTKTNMVIHYSVSTRHAGANSNNKVLVGGADETLSRGGIGVSSQVNMGSETEPEMIERMGELNRQAHLLGLPSFGMVYARGPNLNPVEGDLTGGQAHAVRLAFELGCDAAKTTWTGTQASFAHVVAAAQSRCWSLAALQAATNERFSRWWPRLSKWEREAFAWGVRCLPTPTPNPWHGPWCCSFTKERPSKKPSLLVNGRWAHGNLASSRSRRSSVGERGR
jgi:hypothetical protein